MSGRLPPLHGGARGGEAFSAAWEVGVLSRIKASLREQGKYLKKVLGGVRGTLFLKKGPPRIINFINPYRRFYEKNSYNLSSAPAGTQARAWERLHFAPSAKLSR